MVRARVTFLDVRHGGTRYEVTVRVPHLSRAGGVARALAETEARIKHGPGNWFHPDDWHVYSVVEIPDEDPAP